MRKGVCSTPAWLVFLIAFFMQSFALAQVSGVVTDQTGIPLPGATVVIKNTTTGTVTDENGAYVLETSGDTIVVSFIGYATQEIAVGGRSVVNVTLEDESTQLNEIVVIGYQEVRKRDLTGAVAVIRPTDANRNVASTIAESIQGLASGVTVRNTGAPGAAAKIDIRGAGTFAGNNPLYIIDGMYSDATPDFNPNDVESIQILKDASAAAIYGSRAANGVIIITTKQGREGPMRISGSVKAGVQQIRKTWDMMGSEEYVNTARQIYQNAGQTLPSSLVNPPNVNTDWQDEFLRTGDVQDYNLTLSGGSSTANFLISGNFFSNTGPVIDNEFQRGSLRINTSGERGRFRIGENLSFSYTHDDFIASDIFTNPFVDMITMLPILPVQDVTRFGGPTNPEGWAIGDEAAPTLAANVIALQNLQQNNQRNYKLRGNAFAEYRLFDFLNYRFNVGTELSFDHFEGFRRPGTVRQGTPSPLATLDENRANFRSFLFEHTLNFDKTFGRHRINSVVGISNQRITREILIGQKSNLPLIEGTNYFTNLNQGDAPAVNGRTDQYAILGYLGRLNYTFADKYLVSLTFRRDGDSRFGRDYRWGNFPAASVAWRISQEPFFKSTWLSDLKVRASYGELGNSEFLSPWQYNYRINPFPRAVFGNDEEQLGATNTQLANPDLRWETKKTTNFGLDAAFFNSQLSLSAEYFIAKTEDVLTSIPLPGTAGNAGANPPVNAASLENRGFELSTTFRPALQGDFNWNVTLNLTSIRNKVTGLGNIGSDTYIQVGDARTQIGRAIGEWYVLQTDGIFQTQQEVEAHKIQPNAKPGDIRYVDTDGDGKLDLDKDRVFAGSPWADLEAGLILGASFKGLSFSMQWYGVFGNQIYNRPRYNVDRMDQNTNFRAGIQPWTPQNPNTDFPRVAIGNADEGIRQNVLPFTDRWLEDGSYVRLRNIEIGYTFPSGSLSNIGFDNIRVYVSGQNLLTITDYTGLDPDITGVNIFERGLDNGQYPALRIFSAGVNFGF
ncbi:MAG: SusC/RagA family TonB-linked outer membrane protein [Saprospiraceae bacterium]